MTLSDIIFNGDRSPGDIGWSSTGDFGTVSGLRRVREAVLRRLITNPGTLLHRPTYGAGLMRFQNAPLTLDVQQRIIKLINDEVLKEPEVTSVNEISLSETSTPNSVLIKIRLSTQGYENVTFELRPFNAMVG